jgi:hypothetical protein
MNSDSSHLVHDMQTEAISRSTFNLTQVAAGLPLASPTTKCLSHARMSTSDVKYLTSGRLLWCLWLHSLMNGVSPPSFSRSTRRQLAALDALRQPLGVGRMVPHIRRHTHSCRCLHTWSAYRRRCIARVSPAATFGTVTGVRVGGTTGVSTGASVSARVGASGGARACTRARTSRMVGLDALHRLVGSADRRLPACLSVLCMARVQLLAALASCGAFRQPARVVLERLDARRGLTLGLARSQSRTGGLQRRRFVAGSGRRSRSGGGRRGGGGGRTSADVGGGTGDRWPTARAGAREG